MRSKALLGKLSLVLLMLGAGTSVSLAMADSYVNPRSTWHQNRYKAVAQYLRAQTQPETRIFVWGNSPSIYLYAHRRMASRYISVNYQTGRVWGTPANDLGGKPDTVHVPTMSWTNLMADLERNLPEFIVDAAAGKLDKMDEEPIAHHPRIAGFVAKNYRLDCQIMGVPLYRRK